MQVRAEILWLSQAECELCDITAYYARIAPSLADSLANEVERGLTQLGEFPFSAPEVTSSVRRYCLTQFPFAIYYRPSHGVVLVAAVFPQRADPRLLHRKLSRRLH